MSAAKRKVKEVKQNPASSSAVTKPPKPRKNKNSDDPADVEPVEKKDSARGWMRKFVCTPGADLMICLASTPCPCVSASYAHRFLEVEKASGT